MLDMQGTPQKPDPNKLGMHIPIRIRLEPPVSMTLPSPEREEDAPKRAYLKKYHFEEHGYDEACEGCVRLRADMPGRPHLEACRRRMYEAMRKTEKGRKWMEKTEEKIDEYMETQHKKDKEGESAKAQEGIAEDPEGGDANGSGTEKDPIEIDEEDGLTLEEFGKKRKEEKVKEERANKKSNCAMPE